MKFKFALVEGGRREAERGLLGKCPFCGDAMIAKCGEVRVWHWAHRGTRTCDPWHESETEWHRDWKNKFPEDWQERIHSANGEKHIADVKTEGDEVIEFQHSKLRREERESREAFYQKMVWVVDGLRLKRDRAQFFAALDAGIVVNREPLIISVLWKEGALLREWGASRVPVYFDFGMPILWRLNPSGPHGRCYLSTVLKTEFLRVHIDGEPFEEPCTQFVERIAARHLLQQAPQPLLGFKRYIPRRYMPKRYIARRYPRF